MAEIPENQAPEIHSSFSMKFDRSGLTSANTQNVENSPIAVAQGSPQDSAMDVIPGLKYLSLPDADFQRLKGVSETSSDYFTVDLPSKFVFYPFKQLSVKLVNGKAQAKFTRAANDKSIRHSVEAVSSLLGDGISAYSLTLKDYNWLLYWLRFASYTKFEFTHIAVCSNEGHLRRIIDAKLPKAEQKLNPKEHLDEKSLRSIHVLNSSLLKEKDFDPTALAAASFPALEEKQIKLKSITMMDTVDYSEYLNIEDPDYQEKEVLANLACYISTYKGQTLSFADRVDLVGNLLSDCIDELKTFEPIINDYGVQEFLNVKCSGCGAEVSTEVSISAHSFCK